MSGTKAGGKKAAATNKARHGEKFYAKIGQMGGRNGHTGGFNSDKVGKDGLTGRERAIIAGAKGGRKSRRGPVKHESEVNTPEHAKTENIRMWQRVFRHGKTVIDTEAENA